MASTSWTRGVVREFQQRSSYSFVALDGGGDAFLLASLRRGLAQSDEVEVLLQQQAGQPAPRVVRIRRVGWRDPRLAARARSLDADVGSVGRAEAEHVAAVFGNRRTDIDCLAAWSFDSCQYALFTCTVNGVKAAVDQLVVSIRADRLGFGHVVGKRSDVLSDSFGLAGAEKHTLSMNVLSLPHFVCCHDLGCARHFLVDAQELVVALVAAGWPVDFAVARVASTGCVAPAFDLLCEAGSVSHRLRLAPLAWHAAAGVRLAAPSAVDAGAESHWEP